MKEVPHPFKEKIVIAYKSYITSVASALKKSAVGEAIKEVEGMMVRNAIVKEEINSLKTRITGIMEI